MNKYKHYLIVNMPYSLLHVLITKKALKLYLNRTLEYIIAYASEHIKQEDTTEWIKCTIQDVITYPERSIIGAFTWQDTEQGFDYWYEIHEEFLIYLENEKKKNLHIW